MTEVVVILAIVVYVIGGQLRGGPLRGRRLILLPGILTVIGIANVSGYKGHVGPTDVALIGGSIVVAITIGLAQGTVTRLESRDGALWGQLPLRGLWLWLGLIGVRIAIEVVAHGAGAHLAASTAPLLLTLGLNRLAQALVIGGRAMNAGIPFAPEKNGQSWPNLSALQGELRR
jgi:hypothetical protein